jgi:hypothetical protein
MKPPQRQQITFEQNGFGEWTDEVTLMDCALSSPETTLLESKPNGNRIKRQRDMGQVNPITPKELGQNCYDAVIILAPAKRQRSRPGSRQRLWRGERDESFIIAASEHNKKSNKCLNNKWRRYRLGIKRRTGERWCGAAQR